MKLLCTDDMPLGVCWVYGIDGLERSFIVYSPAG